MINYIDPIPPIVRLLDSLFVERVYGNRIPAAAAIPCILVKNAGGSDYTRLLLLTRTDSDISAMVLLIEAMNDLIRNAANVQGLRVIDISKEVNPISSIDQDTGKPEAWCYLRLEHLEV